MLDFEGNSVRDINELRYLRRMSKLTDLNCKGNPIASKGLAYYQKIQEIVPGLQVLDDEPIGSDDEGMVKFIEGKQRDARQQAEEKKSQGAYDQCHYRQAMQSVLAQFE